MTHPTDIVSAVTRKTLRCDCCGTVGMAYEDGTRYVITRRDHGERHTLILPKLDNGASQRPE